jgi:hypothetical protein
MEIRIEFNDTTNSESWIVKIPALEIHGKIPAII